MDSLTDERNAWFNAVRLEDAHDYSSASLSYIEDASRCLSRGSFIRSAMSAACAASCLAALGDLDDSVDLYSVAGLLYEHNAEVSIAKSLRESLWSLLHAFEYFTLISDHASAERASKKYADLARRVDRFETPSIFEALKTRKESVLASRPNLSPQAVGGPAEKTIPDLSRIRRSLKSFLQQVQAAMPTSFELDEESGELMEAQEKEEVPLIPEAPQDEEEDEGLIYETESELHERHIVS
jgi:hypothetical protein